MSSARTAADHDYGYERWALAALAISAVALYWFPAAAISLALGVAIGLASLVAEWVAPAAREERRRTGWSLLAAAGALALIYAALAAAGPLAGEVGRFLAAWHPPGPTLIDASALERFPWGWVPIAAAIGLALGGAMVVVRNRR